jgi:hypothetical protein
MSCGYTGFMTINTEPETGLYKLDGPLMWITNMRDPVVIEDITPAASQSIFTARSLDEVIGNPLLMDESDRLLGRAVEVNLEQNHRILKTRVPETITWWNRQPDGSIHKFVVTKSRLDKHRVLVVAHDTTHLDLRILWLELCNFKNRKVRIDIDHTLSFKNMEALDLMIRGYSAGTAAKLLHISEPGYRKRLNKCCMSFGVSSVTGLRIRVSESGFIHLLMIAHLPPYDPGLTLEFILDCIDETEVANPLP